MLDIKYLRQNLEAVRRKMSERGQNIDFDRFVGLDAKRRDILQAVETLRNERNSVSKQVGELKKKKEDASELIAKMGDVSAKIKEYDETLRVTEEELNAFVMIVPNIQHESVPQGGGSEDNTVVRTWGEKPSFCFAPKQHFELGENLNILDFARGAKITGARFTLYRGAGAQLERAIDQAPSFSGRGSIHHFGIQTDDIEGVVEKLKAMGVPFKKGVTDIGVWKYVMVPAPDHVLIELFQVNRDALPEDYRSYFD